MKFLVVGGILLFAIIMLWRNFKRNLEGKCNCSICDPKNKEMCQEAIKKSKEKSSD